jgi:O-antigen/teichoic acid export membrane protein
LPASGQHVQQKVNRGLAWIGAAQTVISVLDIVTVLLILKFFVSREDFGIQSLAYTLYPVFDIAADLGVSAALIQRDDHTPEKLSTVFWFNVLLSLLLFGALCLIGPALGAYHGHPVIGTLLIAYGGKLILQNVYSIPMTLMKKQLRFPELSVIRVVSNLVEAVVKVTLAALGLTIWCFTLAALSRVVVTSILCQVRHPWRPQLVFRPREAADYARFGLRSSASGMLYQLYTNLDYQVVGHFFGASALGVYKLAYEIVLDPVKIISNVVTEVAFPAFARMRSDADRLREQFITFMRLNLVTVLPFVALILLVVDDFLVVSVGRDWVGAAPAARLLCFVGMLRALSFVCPPLLDGVGKPQLTLRYMIVAAFALTGSYVLFAELLGPRLGYLSVAWAWVVGYPIAFAVLLLMTLTELELSLWTLLRRIGGIVVSAAIATGVGGVVAWILRPRLPPLLHMIATAVVLLGVLGVLLAYWQGISPRSVGRSMATK